jgi:hypothetical protein
MPTKASVKRMIKAMKKQPTQTLIMSILLVFVMVMVLKKLEFNAITCTGSERKEIKITRWSGRLGNNIRQLFNAIQISLYYGCNISIPNHDLFDTRLISRLVTNSFDSEFVDVNLQKQLSDNELKSDFFYVKEYDKRVFECNIQQTVLILKESFKIREDETYDLGENHVVLHIRGGDICSGSNVHELYVTPPIYYYKTILDSNNYKRIILISEDRLNPTVDELLKLYPNIEFKIQSLEKDIKLLLSAKNVVMSFGTFVPSLLIVSNRIEKMYKPSYAEKGSKSITLLTTLGIEVHDFELSDYFNKQSPWENSKLQRDLLINYQPST